MIFSKFEGGVSVPGFDDVIDRQKTKLDTVATASKDPIDLAIVRALSIWDACRDEDFTYDMTDEEARFIVGAAVAEDLPVELRSGNNISCIVDGSREISLSGTFSNGSQAEVFNDALCAISALPAEAVTIRDGLIAKPEEAFGHSIFNLAKLAVLKAV